MVSKIPDIHFVNGEYYNYNGRNPDKPLTVPYAKRLISVQKRYGAVDTKTASGHGKLKEKRESLKTIQNADNNKERKDATETLNKIGYNDFLNRIKTGEIDSKNLRTRFRAGFRPYDVDSNGNVLDSYTSVSYAKAYNGVIGIDRFINQLTAHNDTVFHKDARGGFKYVIYDTKTKEVHYEFQYGEPD